VCTRIDSPNHFIPSQSFLENKGVKEGWRTRILLIQIPHIYKNNIQTSLYSPDDAFIEPNISSFILIIFSVKFNQVFPLIVFNNLNGIVTIFVIYFQLISIMIHGYHAMSWSCLFYKLLLCDKLHYNEQNPISSFHINLA
jgi:hypothetical protein